MTVADYFKKFNNADVIFDPIPSYLGVWHFDVEALIELSKVKNGINLFKEFLNDTYYKPLKDIFKTDIVCNFKVSMISTPNENKVGRCLKYSKYTFFESLLNFLDQKVDRVGLSKDEQLEKLMNLAKLINSPYDTRDMAFANALKEKANRLINIKQNQLNSLYFESAMEDYEGKCINKSFSEYIDELYNDVLKMQQGMIHLSDFFDKKIDYQKMYDAFDEDEFYLLFAKIIYDFNMDYEKKKSTLNSSSRYLYFYNKALEEVAKVEKHYNPEIFYKYKTDRKIRVSRYEIEYKINKLFNRYPEAIPDMLPDEPLNNEKYKDINLLSKIANVNHSNWQLLNGVESISKTNFDDVNMKMNILDKSGYIVGPFLGINSFSSYCAFIYANEKVIIESLDKCGVTYILTIDKFLELDNIDNLKNRCIKRLFHTSINNWHRNLYNEINGKYRVEDAINFINSIRSNEVNNDGK